MFNLQRILTILSCHNFTTDEYAVLTEAVAMAKSRDEARAEVNRLQKSLSQQLAITEGLDDHEKSLTANKGYIAAIKSYRARTGCGLKVAKDVVDAYRTSLGI